MTNNATVKNENTPNQDHKISESINQKKELFKRIWNMADEIRGEMDAWDFKNYVLSMLFYRYLSENLTSYINNNTSVDGDDFDYAAQNDADFNVDDIHQIVNQKGFCIKPSQLFKNFYNRITQDQQQLQDLNTHLKEILTAIEQSANHHDKYADKLKNIFEDVDLSSSKLGKSQPDRNEKIKRLMGEIAALDLGNFQDASIDIFGDAYEYLMAMYASKAGKSGGEYYTPQEVSKLLVALTVRDKTKVSSVYDPACGSGSLLLQVAKKLGKNKIERGYFGQDSNPTTYKLCLMNMVLHDTRFENFEIECGDTLKRYESSRIQTDKDLHDVVVCNPPYSKKWVGEKDPLLLNDPRFQEVGKIPPASKADFAFVLDCLWHLKADGYAAIVCFPGIFYREGAEKTIREWFVNNNYIHTIIAMPDKLFYGTGIGTYILVLHKNKQDNSILFIDASQEFVSETNQNKLSDANIAKIYDAYMQRGNVAEFATLADKNQIVENGYDLSVYKYVTRKTAAEKAIENIDIVALNAEIAQITNKTNALRAAIDEVISQIEKSYEFTKPLKPNR